MNPRNPPPRRGETPQGAPKGATTNHLEFPGLRVFGTPAAVRIEVDFRGGMPATSDLAAAFYAIHAKTPRGVSWLVDVSACDPLPLALCRLLVIFQAKLREGGGDLNMVGANYDLLPSEGYIG